MAMADLGEVAIGTLWGGWSASTRNGDGRVLTLGPCDIFPPHCWSIAARGDFEGGMGGCGLPDVAHKGDTGWIWGGDAQAADGV
jgi:hypothetical protein